MLIFFRIATPVALLIYIEYTPEPTESEVLAVFNCFGEIFSHKHQKIFFKNH